MDTFEILSQLCSAAGVSGAEGSAAEAAAKLLEEYGEVTFDNALGSVICRVEQRYLQGWKLGGRQACYAS